MRHGDRCDCSHDIGVQHRSGPGYEATPSVSDDHGLGFTEGSNDACDICSQRARVVAARWMIGARITAQVHRQNSKAGIGNRCDVIAPGPPERRKSVEQDYSWAFPCIDNMEPATVGRDISMRPRARRPDDGLRIWQRRH